MTDIVERLRIEQRAFGGRDGMPEVSALFAQSADEIMRLRERLEMDFVWQFIDGVKTRVKVAPGSIPDGIDCRNETIKLQDRIIADLRKASA